MHQSHHPIRHLSGTALLLLVLAAWTAPVTSAATITEFPVPTSASGPNDITTGPDGALWFTEKDSNQIGRLDPAAASPGTTDGITEFPVPTAASGLGQIAAGSDGALWFVEARANMIGRLDPTAANAGASDGITEFTVPTPSSGLTDITAGPPGNAAIWFAENGTDKVGEITTDADHTITEFTVPDTFNGVPIRSPFGITAGPDGALWFTEIAPAGVTGNAAVRRITTSGTISRAFPTGVDFNGVVPAFRITAGPPNDTFGSPPEPRLWYTEAAQALGWNTTCRTTCGFDTDVSSDSIPSDVGNDVTTGPDRYLWITTANGIERISIPGFSSSSFSVPAGHDPLAITPGPDGAIWFTEPNTNQIGRIPTDGYPVPAEAALVRAPLVPTYAQCGAPGAASPNTQHGGPLSYDSCSPPTQASPNLTVGPRSNGFMRLQVTDTSVKLDVSITDVRCRAGVSSCGASNTADGPDYTGRLFAAIPIRVTDRFNTSGDAATLSDRAVGGAVICTQTADPAVGSTCSLTTTLNALQPGLGSRGGHSVWELQNALGGLQVLDGTATGTPGAASQPFEKEGLYVP
jgi:virginiamycin B lyase